MIFSFVTWASFGFVGDLWKGVCAAVDVINAVRCYLSWRKTSSARTHWALLHGRLPNVWWVAIVVPRVSVVDETLINAGAWVCCGGSEATVSLRWVSSNSSLRLSGSVEPCRVSELIVVGMGVHHFLVLVFLTGVQSCSVINRLMVSSAEAVSSRGIGGAHEVVRLHMWQNLGEALSVPGYSLIRLSEWQFVPSVVICFLTLHIDQILLTRGTSEGSQVTFTEHSILFVIVSCSLFSQKFHDFSDLLT